MKTSKLNYQLSSGSLPPSQWIPALGSLERPSPIPCDGIVSLGVFPAAAQETRYQITQPVSLSAPARGSVTLPCAFTYPREIEPLRDVQIYWRWGGFHGKFIYNHTEGFTHPDYGGRIILVGDPRGSRTASIRIDWLWESDASEYVCHVRVQKQDNEWEQWRSVPGINLTVTALWPCSVQTTSSGLALSHRSGMGAARGTAQDLFRGNKAERHIY
uniref:Immunoglobulin V-set domain-containing protein n=1 Tax=Chrysemys picta bellii TaxID=8478 RepID=A0A8C3F5M6_CHRPI